MAASQTSALPDQQGESDPVDLVEPFASPAFQFTQATAQAANPHISMNKRAMDRHLLELQAIRQTHVEHTNGTVLVIVKFPKNTGFGCDGARWTDYTQRISHDKLVASGSSKLLALLSPRKQDIFRRRHGWNTLPEGVEYILDLTPLDESDDHANVTCALWLPEATKIWWLAGHYESIKILTDGPDEFRFNTRPDVDKAVGAILALGHDDVCKKRSCALDEDQWDVQGAHGIYEPGPRDNPIPEYRIIDGYCPIRHRVAIIRLIRALNGSELLINSATRMWTLANMAIHLDLTSIVRDQIAQWFMASPNSKFIEMFPEESFKIAYDLQLKDVVISAFQILVNEQAIDLCATRLTAGPPLRNRLSTTWNLRKRGDYGDYPQDPIEHASRVFADRINAQLSVLQSNSCLDSLDHYITPWQNLVVMDNALKAMPAAYPELANACKALMNALVKCFHAIVRNALDFSSPTNHVVELVSAQRAHYLDSHKVPPFTTLYEGLNDSQRAMTPFFWTALLSTINSRDLENKPYVSMTLTGLIAKYNILLLRALKEDFFSSVTDQLYHEQTARFNMESFRTDLAIAIGKLRDRITFRGYETIQMVLSDHLLLKLDDDELKFLPMWAGGVDDGSGGVFQDPVPNTEMGPIEPGPGYHTGYTVAESETDRASVAWSGVDTELGLEIRDLDLDDATVARSLDVQEGSVSTTQVPNRNRVVVAESVASEQFSSDMGDFADAMYVEPAEHQPQGQAIASFVENPDENPDYMIEDDDDAVDAMTDDSDSTIGGSDYDVI